ncbi:calbindin isoform X2 [Mobula hypostoma]|uniref:calbindin isoform X2 n=1 Tax=Mobula hypostoma TaxID=723540 RepID=UPI002FC35EB6
MADMHNLYLQGIEDSTSQFLEIWHHYDNAGHGYIDGRELQNFIGELQQARKGVGLTWRRYDEDHSGFIEADELKSFLRDLLKKANRPFDEVKLEEYTLTTLKMFDSNNDGKLGLSEMARLLPDKENFLLKFQGVNMSSKEFNDIFDYYDQDGNGYIDENELDALLKDLCEKNKQDLDIENLTTYKKNIMALSDGGKLFRKDLALILCAEEF